MLINISSAFSVLLLLNFERLWWWWLFCFCFCVIFFSFSFVQIILIVVQWLPIRTSYTSHTQSYNIALAFFSVVHSFAFFFGVVVAVVVQFLVSVSFALSNYPNFKNIIVNVHRHLRHRATHAIITLHSLLYVVFNIITTIQCFCALLFGPGIWDAFLFREFFSRSH